MTPVKVPNPSTIDAGLRRKQGRPRFQELGLVLVLVTLFVVLTSFSGSVTVTDPQNGQVTTVNRFLRADNLDKLAKNTSFFAIMAIGATLVIITGGIDLSVGATYCLAAVSGALFLHHFGPEGSGRLAPVVVVPAAVLICLGTGALCGFINGSLIVLLRVHPFVVTLGTMAIYRGVAFVTTKAQAYTNFPPEFTSGFIRHEFGRNVYPVPMIIMILVTIAAAIYLRFMVGGRQVYAVGGNEEAARFSGLRTRAIKVRVYAMAGLTAGVAAMIMLGYYGSASSDAGSGYELDVIAAAVVGGASLSGGRGTAIGALLGALIIQTINNSIVLLNIDQNYSQIIIGAVIVVAVVLDRLNSFWQTRKMIRAVAAAKNGGG